MNQLWTSTVAGGTSLFSSLPFSGATWFVLATLLFFIWLFVKADKDKTSPVRWEHLIIDSNNDRTSPYKVGYLIGLIVGTWIILTLTDTGKLNFDMFGVYLTYLLGGAGVNSFVKRGERNRYDRYGDGDCTEDDEMYDDQQPRKRQRHRDAPGAVEDYGPPVADVE